MPYTKINELPDQVQDVLPVHGQEIYRATYNNALDQYNDPADRNDDSSIEETAHKVAWAAVKKVYHKNDAGNWVRK